MHVGVRACWSNQGPGVRDDPEAGNGRVYGRARQRLLLRIEGDGWMKCVDDVGRSDLRFRWSVGLR